MTGAPSRDAAAVMQRESIERSRRAWIHNPQEARIAPVVHARSDGSQAAIEAGPFSWRCDLPVVLGGGNQAPSPVAALLGALAGCAVVLIRDVLAPQQGVQVDAVDAEVRCRADFRGLLAMPGADAGLQDLEVAIRVQSPDDASKVRGLYEAWLLRCPVYLALGRSMEVRTALVSPDRAL